MALYRHHTTSLSQLVSLLQRAIEPLQKTLPLALIGDFNLNILDDRPTTKTFIQILQNNFNLQLQLQQETTDAHSGLDHIYTTRFTNLVMAGVLEATWSDHKMIWMAV